MVRVTVLTLPFTSLVTLGKLHNFSHFCAYNIGAMMFLPGLRQLGLESHSVWHKGMRWQSSFSFLQGGGKEFMKYQCQELCHRLYMHTSPAPVRKRALFTTKTSNLLKVRGWQAGQGIRVSTRDCLNKMYQCGLSLQSVSPPMRCVCVRACVWQGEGSAGGEDCR